MKKVFLFLAVIFGFSPIFSQTNTWQIPKIKKYIRQYSSSDGTKLAYLTKSGDEYKLVCVNEETGKPLWEKSTKFDLEEISEYFGFIDNSTFYIANAKSHDFLDANNGKTLTSVPLKFEEWDDILYSNAPSAPNESKPISDSNLIVYFGKPGIQIIDLKNKKEIYSTDQKAKEVELTKLDNYYILKVNGDSIYIVNTDVNKLVFKESIETLGLNKRFKVNVIVDNDHAIFYCEDDVKIYDFRDNKVLKIAKDPIDYDFSAAMISDSILLYCISDEGVQTIYDASSQKKIVETVKDSLPGYIENIVLSKDRKFLTAFLYNNDERQATVAKIGTPSGKILWKKNLFEYSSKYKVDNVNPSSGSKILGGIGRVMLASVLSNASIGGSGLTVTPRYGLISSPSYKMNKDIAKNKLYKGIQSCGGYARSIEINNDKAIILCVGEIKPLIESKKDDEEFMVTLDMTSGKVLDYQKLFVTPEPENSNAINENIIKAMPSALAIIGKNDIYFYKNSKITNANFADRKMKIIGTKEDCLFISSSTSKSDFYDFWRFDASKETIDKKLIARTYEEGYIDYSKFSDFNNTLLLTEDDLQLLPILSDIPKENEKLNPIWTKTVKEIKYDYFKSFAQDTDNFIQGLSLYKGYVIIASKEYLSGVKIDGSCLWNQEWKIDPEETPISLKYIGSSLVALSKSKGLIVNLDCNKPLVFFHSIDDYPKSFSLDKSKKGVVRFDDDDNLIYNRLDK